VGELVVVKRVPWNKGLSGLAWEQERFRLRRVKDAKKYSGVPYKFDQVVSDRVDRARWPTKIIFTDSGSASISLERYGPHKDIVLDFHSFENGIFTLGRLFTSFCKRVDSVEGKGYSKSIMASWLVEEE